MNNMINPVKKLNLALLLTVVTLVPSLVFADSALAPDNFAFNSTLSPATNSLREVTLSTKILEAMQRRDFGDLRVFNAQGQEVPHQFSTAITKDKTLEKALNFYPFSREQAADPAGIRIQILQKNTNQSINIVNGKQQSYSSREYQYIAENKNNKQSLCKLSFNWDQPRPNMILPIKIEGSDNLQNWSTLNNSVNISKLDYAGSQLVRSGVSITCSKHDYLRLTWLKPEQGLKLNSITAIYKQPQESVLQQKNIGRPNNGDDNHWYFKTDIAAPITQLELIAPTDGLLYKGRLYSRPDDSSEWRYRQSITQYRLKISETRLSSDPLKLSATSDNCWKIELDTDNQFTNAQLPDIKLGWQQQKLVFLAQGEAPFTLAYGNPEILPASSNGISQLIRTLQDAGETPEKVTLEESVSNTKVAKLEKNIPWKVVGLWVFLILGTAVLGYMAYHLFQQMNKGNSD